jgi:hypothetical protein
VSHEGAVPRSSARSQESHIVITLPGAARPRPGTHLGVDTYRSSRVRNNNKGGLMRTRSSRFTPFPSGLIALALALAPTLAGAQQTFSKEQLDQRVAPIALYPDSVLSQVLMAATYPADVAARGMARFNPDSSWRKVAVPGS